MTSDFAMEAVKTGMIFRAMVAFGSDIEIKVTEKNALRNAGVAGVTGVVKEGAVAAATFSPAIINAITGDIVKAICEYVGQRFDRLSKVRANKIAWFMAEITDKFNA